MFEEIESAPEQNMSIWKEFAAKGKVIGAAVISEEERSEDKDQNLDSSFSNKFNRQNSSMEGQSYFSIRKSPFYQKKVQHGKMLDKIVKSPISTQRRNTQIIQNLNFSDNESSNQIDSN